MAKRVLADLPEVTAVEIVDLRRVESPNRVSQYMSVAGDAPAFRREGEEAKGLADLWRRLPPGDQSRCHTPPFGLRFFQGERLVQEASICWGCDNIFGEAEGTMLHFGFDSRTDIAQKLLAEIRAVAGGVEDR